MCGLKLGAKGSAFKTYVLRRSKEVGDDAKKSGEDEMSLEAKDTKLSWFGIRCPSATTEKLKIFDVMQNSNRTCLSRLHSPSQIPFLTCRIPSMKFLDEGALS